MYVCMYAYMYVCMYTYMYVCMYACMYVNVFVDAIDVYSGHDRSKKFSTNVHYEQLMYTWVSNFQFLRLIFVWFSLLVCMYVRIHVWMYACMYVSVFVDAIVVYSGHDRSKKLARKSIMRNWCTPECPIFNFYI